MLNSKNVIKFEELSQKWEGLLKKLDIKENIFLPRKNISNHWPYIHYYNENTKNIIEKYLSEDIKQFGYTFE